MKKPWFAIICLLILNCGLTLNSYAFRMSDKDQLTALASGDMFLIEDVSDADTTKHTTLDDINTYLATIYQPLTAYLTDLADGNITSNFVNETYPWADNEVANAQTITAQAGSTWDLANSITALSVYTGAVSLEQHANATASGAAIVGCFDDFTNSAGETDVQGVLKDFDTALEVRCLESVFGTSIGAGLLKDGAVLKASTILQKYHGVDPPADVLAMLGSANDTALRTEIGCGTAATRDADQDLESSDDVTFNKITVIDTISIGASENPLIRFRDSDCPGTDKFTGSINIPHARGNDGNETAWIYFRCMEDGSNTTQMTYDGNVSAWKIPTGKHLFFGTTQWNTSSDKIDGAAIEDGDIKEPQLDVTNSPTDNYLLSYNLAGTNFTWIAAAGGGDLKADGSVPLTANWDVGAFTITALRFVSDQATGTAPFTVASTTKVTNLNADTVDGESASAIVTAARVGGVSANLDDADASIEWEDAADLDATGALSPIVESIAWNVAGMSADGTQCADPVEVTINSGPKMYTAIPADNDGSTLYGHVVMPDSWNAGTVTFELEYLQTAADTSAMNSDICAMCRGAGETVNNTWGSEIAIDDAAVTGSNAVDHTTSGAVTPNGTCAAGDTLWFRWQLDATGTTTACATLHILGMKMEYTSNVGD